MSGTLSPVTGFDWGKVAWRKPESERSDFCSYCFMTIPDESVPLILFRTDGHVAQFCDECQVKWWGMKV